MRRLAVPALALAVAAAAGVALAAAYFVFLYRNFAGKVNLDEDGY